MVERGDAFFGDAANDKKFSFEFSGGNCATGDEDLADSRTGGAGEFTKGTVIRGDIAPTERQHAGMLRGGVQYSFALFGGGFFRGQKNHAGGVFTKRRQKRSGRYGSFAVETVRYLQEQAGAISRGGIATERAAMFKIPQCLQGIGDDIVPRRCIEAGYEADSAAIVIIGAVVQPLMFHAYSPTSARH